MIQRWGFLTQDNRDCCVSRLGLSLGYILFLECGLPSINQDDISITDLFNRVLGNSFSSEDDLLVNVALDTFQQFALCLSREKEGMRAEMKAANHRHQVCVICGIYES